MSYKLEKPYTEKERMDFIVEYNHNQGLRIEEGVNKVSSLDGQTTPLNVKTEQALYALEANEMMAWVDVEEEIEVEVKPAEYEEVEITETQLKLVVDENNMPILDEDGNYKYTEQEVTKVEKQLVKEAVYETQTITIQRYQPIINPNYEAEQAQKEAERIARLKLTRGDVFRGLLQARQVTRAMLRAQLEALPEETPEEMLTKEMALIDFDEALDFYRGNALIDTVGEALGITKEQLDRFFETNDYTVLLPIVEEGILAEEQGSEAVEGGVLTSTDITDVIADDDVSSDE